LAHKLTGEKKAFQRKEEAEAAFQVPESCRHATSREDQSCGDSDGARLERLPLRCSGASAPAARLDLLWTVLGFECCSWTCTTTRTYLNVFLASWEACVIYPLRWHSGTPVRGAINRQSMDERLGRTPSSHVPVAYCVYMTLSLLCYLDYLCRKSNPSFQRPRVCGDVVLSQFVHLGTSSADPRKGGIPSDADLERSKRVCDQHLVRQ